MEKFENAQLSSEKQIPFFFFFPTEKLHVIIYKFECNVRNSNKDI